MLCETHSRQLVLTGFIVQSKHVGALLVMAITLFYDTSTLAATDTAIEPSKPCFMFLPALITGEQEGSSAPAPLIGRCFNISFLMQAVTLLSHVPSPVNGLGNAAQRFCLRHQNCIHFGLVSGSFWFPDLSFIRSSGALIPAMSRA